MLSERKPLLASAREEPWDVSLKDVLSVDSVDAATLIRLRSPTIHGGDLASTGSVKLWLRAQVLSPGKTLGKISTANNNLALAA